MKNGPRVRRFATPRGDGISWGASLCFRADHEIGGGFLRIARPTIVEPARQTGLVKIAALEAAANANRAGEAFPGATLKP